MEHEYACIADCNSAQGRSLTYNELLNLGVERREEVMKFEKFLREQTCWTTAPASTRYHMSETGGLVKHSLNTANTLLRLREVLAPDLSVESCVIVGLYHDVGKVGMPGKPLYLPNPSTWHVQRGIKYIINEGLTYLDVGTRSLYLISKHITLTEEELQAIRFHDGQYVDENKCVAHKECRLTRLLQFADNWSCGVTEGKLF